MQLQSIIYDNFKGEYKDNTPLKPETRKLKNKHFPKQLSDWKKHLKAYVRSSAMLMYPETPEAHKYILTFLGDEG